ncbi:MAG: 6-pyruvoyl tetrahydropterin synthase family protein [Candidatus Thermoplasmatota archaeon]|nr:6-pyruvoyl tetrahydropterin synthase family protein [Candidatus Thermoplasmatota archaeon]
MHHQLQIDGWRSNIRFSSCHMLLRHDKCSRLHGHSYAIHLKVTGELDENHMLADFGDMKKALRSIADGLDHRIILPTRNPEILILENEAEGSVTVDMQGKRYVFPVCDIVKVPITTTTVEELSNHLLGRFLETAKIPQGVLEVSLGVDEGQGQGAWSTRMVRE